MYVFSFLKDPTPDEVRQVLALYRAAKWWQGGDNASFIAGRMIMGSHCFLTATCQNRIIGMGRAISDGVSDAYVQDVAVSEGHRGRGIALELVSRIVEKLRSDGIDWIGLIAERNTEELYGKAGFAQMPQATPMLFKP